MDSQDSSVPPLHHPHPHHHYHHHFQHHPQPLQPSHHSVMVGQTQQHHPNSSYSLPSANNSLGPTTTTSANAAMMHQHNDRFPFNSMAIAPPPAPPSHQYPADGSPSGSGGSGWFNMEPAKKKRGRPRKYSPDNSIGLGLAPTPSKQMSSAVVISDSGGGGDGTLSSETGKRNRGRPPGSVKRQLDALGIPGAGFTPHVILVNSGEDIASKIMAFSQQGPRTVCVLSAHGAICNVTLRQPTTSHGTISHEGWFEIISLRGSFQLSDVDGTRSRNGGLSVSLAGPDGRVLGGGVAGILKAASLVQVVVGSFIAEGKKLNTSSSNPSSNILNYGAQGTGVSPHSPGASSESPGDENNGSSPLDCGSGPYPNLGQQPMQNISMYNTMGWPNSIKLLPN